MKEKVKKVQSSDSTTVSHTEVSTYADTGQETGAEDEEESPLVVEKKPVLVTEDAAEQTTITHTFKLYPEQKKWLDHALNKSKKENDTKYDGPALTYICMEYSESRLGKKKAAQQG